jgi:hypothetical protein
MTRLASTTRRLIVAAVVAVSLVVLGAVFVVARHFGLVVGLPREARAVAVREHARLGGSTEASVLTYVTFPGCAVIQLQDPGPDGDTVSVAVIRRDGVWRVGRTTHDEDVMFDTDDVLLDPDGCRRIATSTGPLVNGAPPDEIGPS